MSAQLPVPIPPGITPGVSHPDGPAGGTLGGTFPDPAVVSASEGITLKGTTSTAGNIGWVTHFNVFYATGKNTLSSFWLAPTPSTSFKSAAVLGGTNLFSGFDATGILVFAAGTTGVVTCTRLIGGTDTHTSAVVTTPAVVSGTAFTPSVTTDAMVYVQTDAAVAGTYTITMGPTTGAEHVVATAVKQLVGSDDLTTVRVPASWKVVVTVVTVTIGHVLVVTC